MYACISVLWGGGLGRLFLVSESLSGNPGSLLSNQLKAKKTRDDFLVNSWLISFKKILAWGRVGNPVEDREGFKTVLEGKHFLAHISLNKAFREKLSSLINVTGFY